MSNVLATIFKGASLKYNLESDQVSDWTGYTGSWWIRDQNAEGSVLANGTLTNQTTYMQLEITPTQSSALNIGSNLLVIVIEHVGNNFKDEIQYVIKVNKSGSA